MATIRCRGRFSLLELAIPPWFERHVLTITPGSAVGPDAAEWRGALVVVEQGAVILESTTGARLALKCGDVLWLQDLPFNALRNEGTGPAVVSSVQRLPRNCPTGPARSGRS